MVQFAACGNIIREIVKGIKHDWALARKARHYIKRKAIDKAAGTVCDLHPFMDVEMSD